MSLFDTKNPPQNEYLKKYIDMSTRFQNIGIAIVFFAIAVNYFGGASLRTISLLIFAIGAIALVFGGSSLRPHNLIKAFAQQCSNEPNDTIAAGLLEAMERNHVTKLTRNSLHMVYVAIEIYSSLPEADPELSTRLQNASKNCLSKKIL